MSLVWTGDNRPSCSEGWKVIHPLAAGVFDVEFMFREMVTKPANEGIEH
jgi:hypothetical protein